MTHLFTPKKIVNEENIGAKLKRARAFKALGLEQVGQKLKIKTAYLESLEEDDYQRLPSGLYSKSYLKKYAEFLGLDYKNLISGNKPTDKNAARDENNNPFSQPLIKKSRFIIFPKLILAPFLIISQPEKSLLTLNNTIEVVGRTEAEAEVRINDELVLNNNDGYFSKIITLKKGLNNIVIKKKKKYSQTKTITRQILIK
ncbi:MAG: helix-turn-helix domain-containing protein [Candidatus Falkowbacteria bacterium]|nr:helix-turn-helix domain-containing protein [Candidatus Falkowbacteria bacterium]